MEITEILLLYPMFTNDLHLFTSCGINSQKRYVQQVLFYIRHAKYILFSNIFFLGFSLIDPKFPDFP